VYSIVDEKSIEGGSR